MTHSSSAGVSPFSGCPPVCPSGLQWVSRLLLCTCSGHMLPCAVRWPGPAIKDRWWKVNKAELWTSHCWYWVTRSASAKHVKQHSGGACEPATCWLASNTHSFYVSFFFFRWILISLCFWKLFWFAYQHLFQCMCVCVCGLLLHQLEELLLFRLQFCVWGRQSSNSFDKSLILLSSLTN